MTGTIEKNHPALKGIKTAYFSTAINFLLAVIKSVTGFVGNSSALVADGIESFSDVVSTLIVLTGLKIAIRPPDQKHPYGHGKAEPIAASVVSLALIGAAITIAVNSVHQIVTPQKAPEAYTLIVLVCVIIIKELMFRYIFKVGNNIKSTVVKTDAWHHRSDAITSAAAFVGISISLIGGKGYESADDWAALIATVIIIYNAYKLLVPSLEDLMDSSPPKDIEKSVRETALKVEGVVNLDKCHVRKMGFDYYVDLVDGKITVQEGHTLAHKVKDSIRESNPRIANVLIHVEPFDKKRIYNQDN